MDKSELNFTSPFKVFQNGVDQMALSVNHILNTYSLYFQKKVNSCCRNKKPDPEVNEYYTESNLYPAYMYDTVMLLNTVMRRFIKYNQRYVNDW